MVVITSVPTMRLLVHLVDIVVMKVRIAVHCIYAVMVLIAAEAGGTIAG